MTDRVKGSGGSGCIDPSASMAQGPKNFITEAIKYGKMAWTGKVAQNMDPPIGKMSDFEKYNPKSTKNMVNKFGSEWLVSRPWAVFNNMGPDGQRAANSLRDLFEFSNIGVAKYMSAADSIMAKHGIDAASEKLMLGIIERTVDGSKVDPAINRAAKKVELLYKGILNEARMSGTIDDAEFASLSAKAKEKGYLTRIYNEDYLASAEGHKAWVEAVSGVAFTNEIAAQRAINSILGEDGPKMSSFLKVSKKSDGTTTKYFIPRQLANYMWANRGKPSKNVRSRFLETDRKIPEELNKVLEPFLIKDFDGIFTSYLQDVIPQIEARKIFGKGKERDYLAKEIGEKLFMQDPAKAESFREVYHAMVRDPSSWIVKSFVDRSDLAKRAVGSIKAFEVLKLAFSQSLQLGQILTNGSALMMGKTAATPAKRLELFVKGLSGGTKSIRDPKLRREIDKTAATVQTNIIDRMGAINEEYHSIAGKKFTGFMSPLEILNNPSKFLRATGFTHMEMFNRRSAAIMGKGYAEHLLEEKSLELAKGGARINPNRIKELDKALEEMGMPTDIDPSKMPLKYLRRAALRFSDEVNHSTGAHNMPIATSSFFGKLAFQFKTFPYQQGIFVKDKVLKPAIKNIATGGKEGSLLPLVTYMGVGTPVGMSLNEFRRFIMADDEELSNTEKVLTGFMSVGGFGIALDVLRQAYWGQQAVMSTIVGPGITDVTSVASGLVKTAASPMFGDNGFDSTHAQKALIKPFVFPYKKEVLDNISNERNAFRSSYE